MFKSYNHHLEPDMYHIVDTDFEGKIHSQSLWHAIIDVYSCKELNVYANMAIALVYFCDSRGSNIQHMLTTFQFEAYRGIDTDELNRYLMLV